MKRPSVRVLAVGVAVVCVFGGFYWLSRTSALRAQAGFQPFTATIVDEQSKGPLDVGTARARYYTFAVRDDGSSVRLQRVEAPDGTWGEHRTITDLQGRKRVFVDDLTQSISTTPLGERLLAHELAQNTACLGTPPPGAKVSNVLGYAAVESSFAEAIPGKNENFNAESWRATSLGCFEIEQSTTWTKPDGTVLAEHSTKALTIVEGQPSAALFAVPTGYVERSPGDILRLFAEKYNRPDHPATDAFVDRNYSSARAGAH